MMSDSLNNKTETQTPMLKGALHLGKYWAAVRGNNIIATISMRVPHDVDFNDFRSKATDLLKMLGDVRSGDIFEVSGEQYFLPRPHKHQNRSKKTRSEIVPIKILKYINDKDNDSEK